MKYYKAVFLLVFLAACNNSSKKIDVVNDKMLKGVPIDSMVKYFPYDTSKINPTVLENWGNEVLFRLREPLLNTYTGNGNFLRLTWLRAFENPIVVRVNRFGDTSYVNLKELKIKQNPADKPIILKDTIINIEKEKWDEILLSVNQNSFWQSIYPDTSFNKDGATWFLECRIDNRYKVIQRWDDGSLSSTELIEYGTPLINYLEKYIQFRSKR
jgi:hypothetical protein